MRYLLDSNVFIQAKNLHYGFDFCPAFWDWLLRESSTKRVFSIDKVRHELLTGARTDPLTVWTVSNPRFFEKLHVDAITQAPRISAHIIARTPVYTPAAQDDFLGGNADYWLIAHAMAEGNITIVTHEAAAPAGINRVKIPDVCHFFGVPCITPFEMLRNERARFIL